MTHFGYDFVSGSFYYKFRSVEHVKIISSLMRVTQGILGVNGKWG